MSVRNNRKWKILFGSLWGLLLGGCLVAWLVSGASLTRVPSLLDAWLSRFGVGRAALIYIVIYTVRPLILFPASLLTVAAGLVFGPWLGILFTVIGENASANVAFAVGRWFGRDFVRNHENSLLQRWERNLRDNGLVAVLIMRLIYLPFDAVNYGCGLSAIRQRDYALGTFLGILPGLVAFVLLGGVAAAGVQYRLLILAASVVFFLLGLAIARRLHRAAPPDPST